MVGALSLALVVLATAHIASPQCPPIGHSALMERLRTAGTVQLVFFSTWCMSCRPHLQPNPQQPTWLLGAFDSRERVERALAQLGLTQPCFMAQQDVLDALEVRRVPSLRLSRAGTLEKP